MSEHPFHLYSANSLQTAPACVKAFFQQSPKPLNNFKILELGGSQQENFQLLKWRHDIKSQVRTLKIFVDQLKKGYRLDDELAEKKLAYVTKALASLDDQVHIIAEMMAQDG